VCAPRVPPLLMNPALQGVVEFLIANTNLIVRVWFLIQAAFGWTGQSDLLAGGALFLIVFWLVIGWAQIRFIRPGSKTFAYVGVYLTGHLREMISLDRTDA